MDLSLFCVSTQNVHHSIKIYPGWVEGGGEETTHCHNIKLSTEPDPKMTNMLELSDRNLKITIINMLKKLVKKVNNWHEQMGIFSRDRNLKNSQMKMLEIKTT